MNFSLAELKIEREAASPELTAAPHHHPGVYTGAQPICPGCVHVGDHALRANLIDNYAARISNRGFQGEEDMAQYINPQELTCIKPEPTSAVSDEEWVVVKGDETETEHAILQENETHPLGLPYVTAELQQPSWVSTARPLPPSNGALLGYPSLGTARDVPIKAPPPEATSWPVPATASAVVTPSVVAEDSNKLRQRCPTQMPLPVLAPTPQAQQHLVQMPPLSHGLPAYCPVPDLDDEDEYTTLNNNTDSRLNLNAIFTMSSPFSPSSFDYHAVPPTTPADLMASMMLVDPEPSPFSIQVALPPPPVTFAAASPMGAASVMNHHHHVVHIWHTTAAQPVPMDATVSPKMLKLRASPGPAHGPVEPLPSSLLTEGGLDQDDPAPMNYESEPIATPRDASSSSPSSSSGTGIPPGGARRQRKQLPSKALRHHALPIRSLSGPGRGGRAARQRRRRVAAAAGPGAFAAAPAPIPPRAGLGIGVPETLGPHATREAKDRFLVQHKAAGMTYKEIRIRGGFSEAESTLRGRFRTLTKSKEARVRKPDWAEIDLYLLDKGVRLLARGENLRTAKIPWKRVANYIYRNGGTYLFGNSTCRKRWDSLVAGEEERGGNINLPFYVKV